MSKDYIHECELIFKFDTPKDAEIISSAVKLDNPEFVELEVDGSTIRSVIKANTLSSMLHTLDDYLACISLAEKLIEK